VNGGAGIMVLEVLTENKPQKDGELQILNWLTY
jgi:hypothetical protein